jgi:hypothetical protein
MSQFKQFMGGKMTPMEAHRKYAWGGRRCQCGRAPSVRIISLCTEEEFRKRADPRVLAAILMDNEGTLPTQPTTYGPIVRLGDSLACKSCSREAERAAAKLPDWVLVEFDRGPKETLQSGSSGGR